MKYVLKFHRYFMLYNVQKWMIGKEGGKGDRRWLIRGKGKGKGRGGTREENKYKTNSGPGYRGQR